MQEEFDFEQEMQNITDSKLLRQYSDWEFEQILIQMDKCYKLKLERELIQLIKTNRKSLHEIQEKLEYRRKQLDIKEQLLNEKAQLLEQITQEIEQRNTKNT